MLVFIAWMIDWLVSSRLFVDFIMGFVVGGGGELVEKIGRVLFFLKNKRIETKYTIHFQFNVLYMIASFLRSPRAVMVVCMDLFNSTDKQNVQSFSYTFYWLSNFWETKRWLSIHPAAGAAAAAVVIVVSTHTILIATTSDLFRIKWL